MHVHSGLGEEQQAHDPQIEQTEQEREGYRLDGFWDGEWVVLREGCGTSSGKGISGVLCRRELAEGELVQAGCSSLG